MGIKSKIVGVTFPNEDGSDRQAIIARLRPGDALTLYDVSSAEFPEAIGVFDAYGRQCGNVSKQLALDLRARHAGWEEYPVTVLEVTGGGAQTLGCNIQIGAPSVDEQVAAMEADVERIESDYQRKAAAAAAAYSAPRRAAPKKAAKPKKTALYVVLALAVLCAIVAIYALVTNQGGGALRAGAASVVLFAVAAFLRMRKKR